MEINSDLKTYKSNMEELGLVHTMVGIDLKLWLLHRYMDR